MLVVLCGFTCKLQSGTSGLQDSTCSDKKRVAGEHVQEADDDNETHNNAIDGKAKHLKVLALALPASCSSASGTTGTRGRFWLRGFVLVAFVTIDLAMHIGCAVCRAESHCPV